MRLSKARKEIVTAMMKDTILEATSSVLAEHGSSGLTMDRVAATAGLAAGSLYNYFRNKDDLLQFIYARLIEPFFQSLDDIVAADLPAPQKLERIVRFVWEHTSKHKALHKLLTESGQDSRTRREARPRALRIFTDIFEQGIREGSFAPHNARHMGRMFHGCLLGLFELGLDGAADEDAAEYVEALVDMVRKGFLVRGEKMEACQ